MSIRSRRVDAARAAQARQQAKPAASAKRSAPRSRPKSKTPRESHGFISSWVDTAWWSPDEELLEVLFHDRARVLYEKVDAAEWQAFKDTGSPGSFVRSRLEKHRFRVR